MVGSKIQAITRVLMNIKVRSISTRVCFARVRSVYINRNYRLARIARGKMSAVPRRYRPSAEFPARFSQSTVGWKYSGRVSNYRRPGEVRMIAGLGGGVTGRFTECVPRNAYRGNHTCVTRDRGARISSSYYRPRVRLHCCTWRGCDCVA